jgi:hypothetical protein
VKIDVDLSEYEVTAGENLGARKAVYLSGSDEVKLAKADSSDTLPCVGFTRQAVSVSGSVVVQTNDVLGGFVGLIPGDDYYLSQDTYGEITNIRPSSGVIVRVGVAKTSTEMDLHILRLDSDTVWGTISGTLSSQTDLQSALDGKSGTGHTHTESDVTDIGDYVTTSGDTMTGNLYMDGAQLRVGKSGDFGNYWSLGFNAATGAPEIGRSNTSGSMILMPDAAVAQWIFGSDSAGTTATYIDCDNNGELRFNTLHTGAVVLGAGGVEPRSGDIGVTPVGSAAKRFGPAYISLLDVDGNISVSGTVDGRDIAADGAAQDNHIANTSNPHSVTAAQVGASATGHTHTSANVTDWNEAVDDRVNNLLVGGDNITLTYDDGANTLTISGGSEITKYVTTISAWTPSGGIYYADVTHSLATDDVIVHAYTTSDKKTVGLEDIDRTDINTVRIWSATNTEDVRVIVLSTNTGIAQTSDHNIQSHTDTNATGAQLNELISGGETTLHTHSGTGSAFDHSELTGVTANQHHNQSHNNTDHSETYITSAGVTYENLNINGDIGTGASQVSQGNHTHGYLNNVVEDTTPQLGGDLDLNQKYIQMDPTPTSNLTGNGVMVSATVDTNSTGVGAALYMASDGNFDEADADSASTMPCRALALETGTGTKKILLQGFLRKDTWNWTPGGDIYVSTTAGGLTHTVVSGTGDQVQKVGFAWTADIIYFNPGDYTIIEVD